MLQVGHSYNGPLARYVQLRVAHALGMPETFSSPPRVSDPDMHHGTCVNVPRCMPGSLTNGFLWGRRRGKRSRHSRRMRNPQFYVSGKRPMASCLCMFDGTLSVVVAFVNCKYGVGNLLYECLAVKYIYKVVRVLVLLPLFYTVGHFRLGPLLQTCINVNPCMGR